MALFSKKNTGSHTYTNPNHRGFALIFAVLATSLLISISLAIFNIALREVAFSSFGRESQIAFYAADTGSECALYWDFRDAFATSSDSGAQSAITCGGQTMTPTRSSVTNRSAYSSFSINSGGVCVDVLVQKTDSDGDGISATRIDSRGHNTCDQSNPTYLERGLRVGY